VKGKLNITNEFPGSFSSEAGRSRVGDFRVCPPCVRTAAILQPQPKSIMKKINVFLAALVAVFSVQCSVFSQQTNLPTPTTFDKVLADIGAITNFAIEPYATYAPKGQAKWGGGLFVVYDVNPQDLVNVGLGLGADWLGQLSLVNANVSLQMPFHPLPSQFPTLELIPVTIAGVGTAYSGNGNFNGAASVVTDAGVFAKFGHIGGGQFNIGVLWGKWQGSGPNDVARYHTVLGWSHGF